MPSPACSPPAAPTCSSCPRGSTSSGPSLSLPIYDGGRLRANLDSKDAQYDLAVAQYNQTLVGAVNEVADDLSGLRSLGDQIDAQQRALDAATQAWDLAQQRYQAGVGSYLEALTRAPAAAAPPNRAWPR